MPLLSAFLSLALVVLGPLGHDTSGMGIKVADQRAEAPVNNEGGIQQLIDHERNSNPAAVHFLAHCVRFGSLTELFADHVSVADGNCQGFIDNTPHKRAEFTVRLTSYSQMTTRGNVAASNTFGFRIGALEEARDNGTLASFRAKQLGIPDYFCCRSSARISDGQFYVHHGLHPAYRHDVAVPCTDMLDKEPRPLPRYHQSVGGSRFIGGSFGFLGSGLCMAGRHFRPVSSAPSSSERQATDYQPRNAYPVHPKSIIGGITGGFSGYPRWIGIAFGLFLNAVAFATFARWFDWTLGDVGDPEPRYGRFLFLTGGVLALSMLGGAFILPW